MFCTQCGAQVTTAAAYCANCGARLPSGSSDSTPPPVTDERGVIHWFLAHDDKIPDFRNSFPAWIPKAEQEILTDVHKHQDRASLLAHVQNISQFYGEVALPQAAMRHQNGGPLPNEDENSYLQVMLMEALLAAKLRILGYFLHEKYGIESDQWS